MKRLTHSGSTLRSRSLDDKARILASLRDKVWPLIEQRSVRPEVYCTFPLTAAADAHVLIDSGEHVGKIVLAIG